MYGQRINRDYRRPFFRRQRAPFSWAALLILLGLIVAIPLLASWQFSALQLAALEAIGMAPTSTPFASFWASEGQARYLAGDLRGAADFYGRAVELQPNNPSYLYEYGRVLIELDGYERAAELGQRLMEIAPQDPRGYALRATALVWSDPAAAIPIAISGVELGQPFAPLNAALAVAYTNIGRYQEALQRGDLAIRQNPMDASARRSYSYPLIFTGRYSEAISQLEQAIAINPRQLPAYFELASLYRRLNQEEMAIAIYQRVLEYDANNARAYLRLCETYAAAGLFIEAEPFCQRALDIDPNYADAHRMQGQLRYSRRNYEGSIESFNTCIRLGSNAIECYYIRGLAHYFLGQCDEAWAVLNEALARVNPDLTPVVNSINIGLTNVTVNCAGYRGRQLPTPIPPTPIPPTPIGGI